MQRHLKRLVAAAGAAMLLTFPAPAIGGAALDQAMANCDIGETINGYLEVAPGGSPSAQARAEMEETNNGRRQVYQRVARENSQPLDVVSRLTGERQVEKAANSNQCYRDDGGWKVRR